MNIVFSMARMQGGGAERVVSELANSFVDRGHSVSIIVTKNSNCVYHLHEQIRLIDLSDNDRGIFERVKAIRKCISENNFDVIISFLTNTNLETILANAGKKVPLIISERNNPYTDPKEKIYRLMRSLVYPFADGYVFQTPDAQAYFNRNIRKKSTIIMNPINPDLPSVFSGVREKRVVNVARLFEQKNQKLFIDAFCEFIKTHQDYIAEIYGDGPMEDELCSYIKKVNMDGKITLRGFSKNVLEDIRSAEMFVLSSDYEGMSNALIEAVGIGVPCISTDHPIGGARMTIKDGENGFLVPVNNVEVMAEKMSAIADDTTLAQKFSSNGMSLRQKLSVSVISSQWLDYIDKVLERKRK